MINPRLLFSSAIVAISFLLVIFSALRITNSQLSAGFSKTTLNRTTNEIRTDSEAIKKAFDFNSELIPNSLPYPGILPDSPFYWVKMVRDRLNIELTRDPQKKSEFLELLANKRLYAGEALILSGQYSLGVTTITKAEKYLFESSNQLSKGKPETSTLTDFAQTLLIHQKIISNLNNKIPSPEKEKLYDSSLISKTLFDNQYKKYLPLTESKSSSSSSQPN